jgi:hypothetical protein
MTNAPRLAPRLAYSSSIPVRPQRAPKFHRPIVRLAAVMDPHERGLGAFDRQEAQEVRQSRVAVLGQKSLATL